MAEIVADETAPRQTQLRVLGVLALIALLLAGIGIHGLLSFMVSNAVSNNFIVSVYVFIVFFVVSYRTPIVSHPL